eukprot:SAG11_NODE_2454_length_3343_cov_13.121455_2_plen_88_part_00
MTLVSDARQRSAQLQKRRVEWRKPRDVLTAPWPWSRTEADDDFDPDLRTEVQLPPVWRPQQQGVGSTGPATPRWKARAQPVTARDVS